MAELLSLFTTPFYLKFWHYALVYSPVILSVPLLYAALSLRLNFLRRTWIEKEGSVLLEILLPKVIDKSPAAMELLINGLIEPITGDYHEVFLEGRLRFWFSFEIISDGGQVRFFAWGQRRWKDIIANRFYSQYPGIEVVEVDDYARDVIFNPKTMNLWGAQYGKVKEDVYPIKTYIDYGLDKTSSEEEQKIDPLTNLIEFLGSIKPGANIWIQILFQPHRKETIEDGYLFPRSDWRGALKKEIKKVIEKDSYVTFTDPVTGKKGKPPNLMGMTDVQKEIIAAMERSMGKAPFDSLIRVIHFGKKEAFDGANNYGLAGSFRQFSSQIINGIKPKWFTSVAYAWQEYDPFTLAHVKTKNQQGLITSYKRRSFFNVPYKHWKGKPFVLNAEELATLFHFPGSVSTTPNLPRIPSKKGEAPANLPI